MNEICGLIHLGPSVHINKNNAQSPILSLNSEINQKQARRGT